MNKGALQAIVHVIAKQSDMTWKLNNNGKQILVWLRLNNAQGQLVWYMT